MITTRIIYEIPRANGRYSDQGNKFILSNGVISTEIHERIGLYELWLPRHGHGL